MITPADKRPTAFGVPVAWRIRRTSRRGQMSFRNPWSRLIGMYERRSASFLFKKSFSINPQWPLVSFTFDDFPRSALLVGGSILSRFGLAGTYYASFGLLGTDGPSGQQFVADDLTTLFEQGHELGCHTFSHCDSWKTDSRTFEDSVIKNQAVLNDLSPGAEFQSFSYPINMPRPMTKARVADYFLCCRGGGQTINLWRIDLNEVSAYFLEKTHNRIQPIKDGLDCNRQARGWLIFAPHAISDNPSPFTCTPTFFQPL